MGARLGYQQSAEHVRKRIASRLAALRAKPWRASPEWLRVKYVDERLDCVQIGALLKCDPKTVWAWLRRYGIQTRPRGSASSPGSFRKGCAGTFAGRKHTDETRARLRAIAIADGRRPWDPAVGPPMRGKRGAETSNWKGGVTPERQAFYASDAWRAACVVVWRRADARCERCAVHHNTATMRGTFHVHHIVSFAVRELRAEPSNLALLCAPCHRFVHSKANVKRAFLVREA